MTHRFNNKTIDLSTDSDTRILSAIRVGEQIGSRLIEHRTGLSNSTITKHLTRLQDKGQVIRIRKDGYPVYMRSATAKVVQRPASVAFAGYRTIRHAERVHD